MAKMGQHWSIFQNLFSKKVEEVPEVISDVKFDKKFRTIVSVPQEYNNDMIDWINKNSNGNVSLQFSEQDSKCFIGFENDDDALFFKIRFQDAK